MTVQEQIPMLVFTCSLDSGIGAEFRPGRTGGLWQAHGNAQNSGGTFEEGTFAGMPLRHS